GLMVCVVEFMMLLLSKNEADCLTSQHKQRCASVNYPPVPNRRDNYRASGLVQRPETAGPVNSDEHPLFGLMESFT
ncbi:MAG: hypothetical protein Q8R64_05550, partial [Sulfurimicrobium sp.]|nr:hypothetical protein [Sulfurimicrobium sp.]